MIPRKLAQGISRSSFKMHILAGPPVFVDAILVILAVLPLITNRNFRISLHDLHSPWVEIFLHHAGRSPRCLAVGVESVGLVEAIRHRTCGHPDQLGLGFFQMSNDLLKIALVGCLVVLAVPMSMIETDGVPMPAGLTIGPQPTDDVLRSAARRPAIGRRVVQVELAREEFPKALVVVPRYGIPDKKIAGKLGVIEGRLVTDWLKMNLGRMNHFSMSLANDASPVDEGPAIFGSGQSRIRRAGTVEVNQSQQVAAPEVGSQEIGRPDDAKRSELMRTAVDLGRFRERIMASTWQTD